VTAEEQKRAAAACAAKMAEDGIILGVGSGTTVNCFIDALADGGVKIEAAVPASDATKARLIKRGFRCEELNTVGDVALYVDGADEIDDNFQMLKGGGGALTREKIIAAGARRFVCVVDSSKRVSRLGKFPLAVEVIPMARGYVARKLAALGANVKWREGFTSDNGNWILDAANLNITDAAAMERQIKLIPGVVENGIFAARLADAAVIASDSGVEVQKRGG
jgi:ribose 5-phosphate isomerase A